MKKASKGQSICPFDFFIAFSCGEYEYEYEYEYDIDALDGSVLNHAKEIDD